MGNWITGLIIALVLVVGAGFAIYTINATANTQIQSIIGIKKVGASTYTTHVSGLNPGDHLRVQLAAVNPTAGNTIDDLQFYSAYAKDGTFGWVKADGQSKVGGVNLTYDLPSGYTVKYIPGTTYYESNETGSWVGGLEADNSHNESLLFVNDSHVGIGYHKQNLPGDPAPYKYIVYYDLQVVSDITPVFNQHSEDQPTFQVRKAGTSTYQTSIANIQSGDELEFKIYVHNNNRGSVALNSVAGVENWPGVTESQNFSITGFVDADNAARASSSVGVSGSDDFALDFEEGSVRIQGWPSVLGSAYDPNAVASDGVITPQGISIGDQGSIDGCWDFLMTITFKAQVEVQPTDTPTATPTDTPTATPTETPNVSSRCVDLVASTADATAPFSVTFTGSGEDTGGSIQEYEFNFGDTSNGQNQLAKTTSNQATHTYNNPGTFIASLLVRDSRGNWVGGNGDDCRVQLTSRSQPTVLGATAPKTLPKTGAEAALVIPTLGAAGYYLYRKFKLL